MSQKRQRGQRGGNGRGIALGMRLEECMKEWATSSSFLGVALWENFACILAYQHAHEKWPKGQLKQPIAEGRKQKAGKRANGQQRCQRQRQLQYRLQCQVGHARAQSGMQMGCIPPLPLPYATPSGIPLSLEVAENVCLARNMQTFLS